MSKAAKGFDKKGFRDVVRKWFFDHYEDPAESSPFVDGDFYYVFGAVSGEDEILMVLSEEFSAVCPAILLQKFAAELANESSWGSEWAKIPDPEDDEEAEEAERCAAEDAEDVADDSI
jgi:hypothetical protein